MKTIKFLSSAISQMIEIGTPADIKVGTFEIKSRGSLHFWAGKTGTFDNYSLKFEIEFRPDHIQMLINLGVNIDFSTVVMANLSPKAKRFKEGRDAIKQGRYAPYYYMGDPKNPQTGVTENWLNATATCSISVLLKLEEICRDNHLHHLAIHNDTVLTKAGFKKETALYKTPTHVIEHMNRREDIRKRVRKLTSHADGAARAARTPYQIACERKFNF